MYAVSNGYKEVIYSGDSDNRLKLLFNGVEYETVNVKSEKLTVTSRILSNGNDRFSLDNFVSKEAELIIHDIDLEDIVEPIDISIGTLVNNEYEYVPIGVFNLVEIPTTDSKKTTIKLRDNSVKFDIPYNAEEIINENGGSATILQILQDICTKCNVELGTTEFVNKDTRVSVWDNSINARQYVMDIAEKAGCIATIDRLGKLILVDLQGGEAVEKISENNTIYINDALPRKLLGLELNGDTQQDGTPTPDSPIEIENVTGRQNIEVCGKNLFDFTDIKEQSAGITTDDDGWITVVGDNSSGSSTLFKNYYTNKTYRLKPSTTYKVICEIKTKTGTIRDLTITSNATTSQANTTNIIPNADATNNRIIVRNFTTKSDFSNCDIMIRSYVAFASGNSGSLTFRISVVEDTSITPETFSYEPYKGKSYEINLGKNLFNTLNRNTLWRATEVLKTNNELVLKPVQNAGGYVQYQVNNIKPDTTYTISCNMILEGITSGFKGTIYVYEFNASGTQHSITSLNVENLKRTFTTQSDTKYLRFSFYVLTGSDDNWENIQVTYSNIQLEKGSQATSYSPYFTPIELNNIPNTQYQDSIKKSTGKNLFNKNNIKVGYRFGSTGDYYPNTGYNATNYYINVLPNTTYATSWSITLMECVCLYDKNKNFISRLSPGNYTFTTTNDTYFIRACVKDANLPTVQLEKGSTATSYEPYLPKGTWYLEKHIGKYVNTNTNDFYTIGNTYTNAEYVGFQKPDDMLNKGTYGAVEILCDKLVNINSIASYDSTDMIGKITARANQNALWIGFAKGTGLTTERQQLNGLIMYYQLSTPTYEEITNEELINQLESIELLEGTNNITITSEDLASPLKITYQQEKQPIELNPLLFESYKEGEEIKVSRVVYEDAIRKFTAGNENEATLYINSANHYITNQEEIDNIYNVINGLEMWSMNISKMIGNPAIDAWDMLQFTYNNKTYKFLGQNTLTYTKNMIQSFDTQIGTNAKSQENVTFNSDESRFKRVFTRIDQAEGNIELNTSQIQTVQSDLQQNYYNLEQTNQLIQNAATGITNTFSEAGGNNVFRNTGLWFEEKTDRDLIYPSNDLFPSGELFTGKQPLYEYWTGDVHKLKEDRAANQTALLLLNGLLEQDQTVPNGIYTISFIYEKLIDIATVKCIINDVEYELTEDEATEFTQTIEVKSQTIKVKFDCDADEACEIYDLMVNAGAVKLAYSQNQNETTTDTVNISKGITITSSDTDTTFKANSDGVRIYDSKDLANPKTKFTDKGMETDYLKAKNEADIVDILIQRVGSHTWLTKI